MHGRGHECHGVHQFLNLYCLSHFLISAPKVSSLHQVSDATPQNIATNTCETDQKIKEFPTTEVKEAANNVTNEPIKLTKEEEFERLKTQGNLHVQKV